MTADPEQVKRNAERAARFRLLAALWGFASEQRVDHDKPVEGRRAPAPGRVRDCHRKAIAALVEVKAIPGASALGAVSTCGSPWVCPVCSPKVAARRQTEVHDAIRAWQGKGGAVVLVTLTLRHSLEHSLADTWDAITAGWASVRNGRGWRNDQAMFGIRGWLRVVEVTHGANGWHPHVHALLFVDRRWKGDDNDKELLRSSVHGRWAHALERHGYSTLEWTKNPETGRLEPVAVDVRCADQLPAGYLADYFAKFGYTPKVEGGSGSLAREVARGDKKRGRKASRTPWEILEAAADDDADALRLWAEWEQTSHGRRQYAWAQGFRESLDLDVMCADRAAVSAEDAALDVVALLASGSYRELVRQHRQTRKLPGASRLVRMLDQAATLEPDTFRRWCARAGLEVMAPAALDTVRVGRRGCPTFLELGGVVPVNPDTGELGTAPGRVMPGTVDTAAPAVLPGRKHVTWNRKDQAHRERVAALRLSSDAVVGGWRRNVDYRPADLTNDQNARTRALPPGVSFTAPNANAARVRALYGL